jgi:arylformamidase
MIIDISQPLTPAITGFPIDTQYEESFVARIGPSVPVNVAKVTLSVHCGSHADAPLHYSNDGVPIAALPLDVFVGPCRVIDARDPRTIEAHLKGAPPRILLRLEDRPDPNVWNPNFKSPTSEIVDMLAAHGAKLMGVDVPSVDPAASKELLSHMAALRHGIAILENLVLHHVEPGDYELIALPLRFENLDASPVRAVLRQL